MYANTVNLSTGVVTTLTLPADVGSVLVHSPDNPALLTYNVPNIHGNTFVAQQNVTDGDVLECINGILKSICSRAATSPSGGSTTVTVTMSAGR